jgi:hypothetical protein
MELYLSVGFALHDHQIFELDDVALLQLGNIRGDLLGGPDAVIADSNKITHVRGLRGFDARSALRLPGDDESVDDP